TNRKKALKRNMVDIISRLIPFYCIIKKGDSMINLKSNYKKPKQSFFIFFLTTFVIAAQEPESIIEEIKVTKQRIDIVVNNSFKKAYLNENFYVHYEDPDIDLSKFDSSITSMPFIMNIISIIWVSGKTYTIESMDETLYESLKKIKEIFKIMYPKTSFNGELIPKRLVHNDFLDPETAKIHEQDIAMLFSSGLDSYTSSLRNKNKNQLLIIVQRGFDIPFEKTKWAHIKQQVKNFADLYGHTTSTLSSNFISMLKYNVLWNRKLSPEIEDFRLDLVEGLGWIGLVAPILLTKGYPTLFIGSTITWLSEYPLACNPLIDDNLNCSKLSAHHDSFDLTRIEKQEFIKQFYANNPIRPYIKVCFKGGLLNCLNCEKCIRTMCGFLLIDAHPNEYGFDISDEEAIIKIKNHLPNGFIPIPGLYINMQKHILKKASAETSFNEFQNWFLDLDFYKRLGKNPKTKIDWCKLASFLPNTFFQHASHENTPDCLLREKPNE
ncbi:MAG: hypothetical protein ABUT20_53690, partial [Bacteroidota bacterium]